MMVTTEVSVVSWTITATPSLTLTSWIFTIASLETLLAHPSWSRSCRSEPYWCLSGCTACLPLLIYTLVHPWSILLSNSAYQIRSPVLLCSLLEMERLMCSHRLHQLVQQMMETKMQLRVLAYWSEVPFLSHALLFHSQPLLQISIQIQTVPK